jgi:hypothetical protein
MPIMVVGLLAVPSRISEVRELMRRLKGFGIHTAGLSIGTDWQEAVPSAWERLVQTATHLIVMPDGDAITEWMVFLLGAAAGRNIPVALVSNCSLPAVYGHATVVSPDRLEEYVLSERSSWERAYRVESALFRLHGREGDTNEFYAAAAQGDMERVQDFLTVGMPADAKTTEGVPILVGAVRGASVEVVQYLVNAGADVNASCGENGETALCEAASRGLETIVGVLLAAGASPNQLTESGQTAIMLAASQGEPQIVAHLLSAGADAEITDALGMSAAEYATLFHHEECESVLKSTPSQT